MEGLLFHYWREGLLHASLLSFVLALALLHVHTPRGVALLLPLWFAGTYLLIQGLLACMLLDDAPVYSIPLLAELTGYKRMAALGALYLPPCSLIYWAMVRLSLRIAKNRIRN